MDRVFAPRGDLFGFARIRRNEHAVVFGFQHIGEKFTKKFVVLDEQERNVSRLGGCGRHQPSRGEEEFL